MNLAFPSQTHQGLTSAQAEQKFHTEGYNSLPSSKPKNYLTIALGVIREPMFILLVACGTLYLIMGDIQGGVMLLGFFFLILGIEFFQGKKPLRSL